MKIAITGLCKPVQARVNRGKWHEIFLRMQQLWPLLLLSLAACGGGMVGTGTGPEESVIYQPRSLLERMGTDFAGTTDRSTVHCSLV